VRGWVSRGEERIHAGGEHGEEEAVVPAPTDSVRKRQTNRGGNREGEGGRGRDGPLEIDAAHRHSVRSGEGRTEHSGCCGCGGVATPGLEGLGFGPVVVEWWVRRGGEDQTKSNRGRSSDSNRTEERRPSGYIHLLYGSTCPRLRRIPLRLTRVAHLEWVTTLMEFHYYPHLPVLMSTSIEICHFSLCINICARKLYTLN
jgi:hypothetical protein